MQGVRGVSKPKPSPKPKPPTNFKHGAYSLLAIRTKADRPDEGTELYETFVAREEEYLRDLGGADNASLAMRTLVNDTVWCDLFVATLDHQLDSRRQFTRKGKPVPIIDLRMKTSAHRRKNFRLMRLKRVTKEATWDDLKLDKASKEDDDEPPG